MIKFSNSKGVSTIALVLTIAVMGILAGVAINWGIIGISDTKDKKLIAELNMVQHAVLEQYTKYKSTKDSIYLVGNKVTKEEALSMAEGLGVMLVNIPDTYSNRDYYILDKASLTEIGITGTDDRYLINYISGEVLNITQKRETDQEALYIRATDF